MEDWIGENLGRLIMATGALGIAAFGIVEGLKWTRLGVAGFARGMRLLGPLTSALELAYGPEWPELLKALYRQGRITGDLPRTLRQGVRAGLAPDNAAEIADHLGVGSANTLKAAARAVAAGKPPSDPQRNVLGRFELAADARIDAALGLADSRYVVAQRLAAGAVALAIAVLVALLPQVTAGAWDVDSLGLAILIGLAAVPLGPISKDVVNGLQAAQQALRNR